jgi:protein involved in temperature-dependent protein secretion
VCYLKTADDRKTRLCQVTQAQDNKASTDEAFGSKLFALVVGKEPVRISICFKPSAINSCCA